MKAKYVINDLQTYPEDMEVDVVDDNQGDPMNIIVIENNIDKFDSSYIYIVAKH